MSRYSSIDLLRGLALLFILLDHIPGSPASNYTLRNFALFDATEVFVFLAGIGSAFAFLRAVQKWGRGGAWRSFINRAWKLHLVYIAVALGMAAFALGVERVGLSAYMIDPEYVGALKGDFLLFVWKVASLQLQMNLSDILPVYVLTALAVPLVVPAAVRAPLITLGASLGVWLAAPQLASYLPSDNGHAWAFNPFAWQLIFTMGVLAAVYGKRVLAALQPVAIPLSVIACGIALAAAGLQWLWRYPEVHDAVIPASLAAAMYPISKPDLGILRIISFFSLAWLLAGPLASWLRQVAESGFAAPLRMCGQNALPCFAIGAFISAGSHVLNVNLPNILWIDVLSDVLATIAMFTVAFVYDGRRRRGAQARFVGPQQPPVTPYSHLVRGNRP